MFGRDNLHHDFAPGAVALGVLRHVAQRVLIGQLVGNLAVELRQAALTSIRGKGASARFPRQRLEHEFGLLPAAAPLAALLVAQADRIHHHFGALGLLEHIVVGDDAGRVFAVGEQNDGMAPDVRTGLRPNALEFAERRVDGVVERRRAARFRGPDRAFERRAVGRERLQNLGLAVEVDDLRHVSRAQAPDETHGGFLRDRQLRFPCSCSYRSRARARSAGAAARSSTAPA